MPCGCRTFGKGSSAHHVGRLGPEELESRRQAGGPQVLVLAVVPHRHRVAPSESAEEGVRPGHQLGGRDVRFEAEGRVGDHGNPRSSRAQHNAVVFLERASGAEVRQCPAVRDQRPVDQGDVLRGVDSGSCAMRAIVARRSPSHQSGWRPAACTTPEPSMHPRGQPISKTGCFGAASRPLFVGGVGGDAVEEHADLELPLAQVGPQHRHGVGRGRSRWPGRSGGAARGSGPCARRRGARCVPTGSRPGAPRGTGFRPGCKRLTGVWWSSPLVRPRCSSTRDPRTLTPMRVRPATTLLKTCLVNQSGSL